MIKWTSRYTLMAGVTLILVTHAVVLSGVAYNRSGTPQAQLNLSQRELQLPYRDDADNSGLSLNLRLRGLHPYENAYSDPGDVTVWLDKDKLASLGFDVSRPYETQYRSSRYTKRFSRSVFLAFEFNGPAYQRALEKARAYEAREARKGASKNTLEAASRSLAFELNGNSRLFLIDAGQDAQALRAKYPDTHRYLILPGRIEPLVLDSTESRPRLLTGRVTEVDVEKINVPAAFSSQLEPIRQRIKGQRYEDRESDAFGFRATVSFGQRFEPWLVELSPTQAPPHPE
ncbi:DUF4824 family protein [Pseudomonas vanderleydeniana]|uniref:DUF4824 family protein n=1 Tax=Pseudomonas vanderleydeniana TaxID=2745495 RepID=A0A9E6TQ09_9PSED|nr:DUF4824 family protein [Pseudomonas vanderleydeniana]QXI26006.1 DUF4824 family protein [Pseudomonas vanderleydeniana]